MCLRAFFDGRRPTATGPKWTSVGFLEANPEPEKGEITPEGIAVLAAIETGLLPKLEPYEAYDCGLFFSFWKQFTKDLAANYGFKNSENVWKVWEIVATCRANYCTQDDKKQV